MNLSKNLVQNMREKHKAWLERCDWCSWPLEGDGCVPGNCSQRPRPRRDDSELREDFRALLVSIQDDDAIAENERLRSALVKISTARSNRSGSAVDKMRRMAKRALQHENRAEGLGEGLRNRSETVIGND